MVVAVKKWLERSSLVRKLGEGPDYHRRLRLPPAEQKDQEGEGRFLKRSDGHIPLRLLVIMFLWYLFFIRGSSAVVFVPGAVH